MNNALETTLRRIIGSPARAGLLALAILIPVLIVYSHSSAPPAFPISSRQAIKDAIHDPTTKKAIAGRHYDQVKVSRIDDQTERVTFLNGYSLVADVALDSDGVVDRVAARVPGTPESGGAIANETVVMLGCLLIFALATATMPLISLRNLDMLVLSMTALAIWLVNQGLGDPSLWVIYGVLGYLGVRALMVGLRGQGRPGSSSLYWHLSRRLPSQTRARIPALVLGALTLMTICVVPTSSGASDVSFASLAGATNLLHGTIPYGHNPAFIVHGDTYPLLNYIAFIPGALISPIRTLFDDPMGGLLTSLAASLIAAAALYKTGARLAAGSQAARGGAAAGEEPSRVAGMRTAIAWLSFPPVLIATTAGDNDLLLSAVLALMLACFHRERVATALLGAAIWVKLIPALFVPIWLGKMPLRRAIRAFGVLVSLSVFLLGILVAMGGGGAVPAMLKAMSFQFERESLRSLWIGLGFTGLQPVAQALLLAAVVAGVVAVRTNLSLREDLVRIAALLAAVELLAQVAANYVTWAYMPWVVVPLLVSLLAPVSQPAPATDTAAEPGTEPSSHAGRRSSGTPSFA